MKKKMLVLVILGIILITVGGVGASLHYHAASEQVTTKTAETYQVKSKAEDKKLELNLSSDNSSFGNIKVVPSKDEDFHLTHSAFNLDYKPVLKWEITEKESLIQINVNYSQIKQRSSGVNLGIFNDIYEPIVISIPRSYSSVTVNSLESAHQRLTIENLNLKDLVVTNLRGSTNLFALTTNTIKGTSDDGSFYLSDIRNKEEIQLLSDTGDLFANDIHAEKIVAKSQSGQLNFSQISAITELESENGDIELETIVGNNQSQTQTGSISLTQTKLKNDLSLKSESGDIDITFYNRPTNIQIAAKTKLGDIRLFDTKKSKYQLGTNGPKVSLVSSSGDISVSSYDDDGEDYDQEDHTTSNDISDEETDANDDIF